ncbi:MAG: DUF3073 domain-containing protein [Mycobacteriales bacterium]|nr:DUF3073 domain-containing protein [Frankia sp.]
MGRGRAKAKQTRIARDLKYSTFGTDLDRLRAELNADGTPVNPLPSGALGDDVDDDEDDDDEAEA